MKNLLYLLLLGIFIYSCSSTRNTNIDNTGSSEINGDTIRIANDTLEYEVIIIEPGFETWLVTKGQPRNQFTQSYLEAKNRIWIQEYNSRANNPLKYGDLYEQPINYEPEIDYGFEVNYLLYNYLVFFQQQYNQKL